MSRVIVSVPATSANLGPGFDSFGLALGIHNRFSAEPAEEWAVEIAGERTGELRTDEKNPVVEAMVRIFSELGQSDRCARIFCVNEIPTGKGLGSSASAIVGGMLLANGLSEATLDTQRIFEAAASMEGHPDNVAAALYGGLTLSWTEEGSAHCVSLPLQRGLAAILAVSDLPYQTERARKLLPAEVPHADASFNAGRAGLLVAGLALGRGDLLGAGMQDRLHEQYRTDALPGFSEVRKALLEAGASGAVLSGAGPTVIGLVAGNDDGEALQIAKDVAGRARQDIDTIEGYSAPVAVPIDRGGARTIETDSLESI